MDNTTITYCLEFSRNDTHNCSTDSMVTEEPHSNNNTPGPITLSFAACCSLICIVGMIGNGLVIYVVIRFTKMKTVTNIYILNLATADLCFLVCLPFLIVTTLLRKWVFGYHMCKVFYILTSINWFTSVFTLVVMSVDRYLAVCHPITSIPYRTPFKSRITCVVVWCTSMISMIPIMLYATTDTKYGQTSCIIEWPSGQAISSEKAFIWYGMLLGFAIPVTFIIICYSQVVCKLRHVGPTTKSKERIKSNRKVTKMVLTVIAVYIVCWLPYWVHQISLTFLGRGHSSEWVVFTFMAITVLSYANSMLNPFIYAFLSENFRKSFVKAINCIAVEEINGQLHVDTNMPSASRRAYLAFQKADNTATKTIGTTTSFETTECITALATIDNVMKQEECAVHQQILASASREYRDIDCRRGLLEQAKCRDCVDSTEID